MKSVRLGDIATLVRGVSFSKEEGNLLSEKGYLPVIRAGSIQESLLLHEGQIWVPARKIKSSQKIRTDDIVMCTSSGSSDLVGKCARSTEDFEGSFGAFCAGIRAHQEKASPSYLYHFLCSPVFKVWTRASSGANIKNIRVSELAEFQVPLPSLPEQKRIAAILDKADAIRRKRQQAIQLADDFLRAVFLDMFGDPVTNPKGWPVDKFGNVFDVRDGTHDSPSYVSSGFPLITSKNIKNGEIDMLDVNYISKEDYELINRRSKVDVGDILMPMIGTIGNPAIVRDEPLFAIKNVALIKLGRSSLPAEFVLALLNGPLLEAAVQQKSRGGTQKFLGLGDIRDLNCYLPDERLVSKYIGIANKVRQFASAYRKADEAGLEGSLSQKAFSGHL